MEVQLTYAMELWISSERPLKVYGRLMEIPWQTSNKRLLEILDVFKISLDVFERFYNPILDFTLPKMEIKSRV